MTTGLSLTRRSVLLTAGGMSLAAPMLGNPVLAQAADDYRAIVCVSLLGGWDNWSACIPLDEARHAAYAAPRGSIAYARSQLSGTAIGNAGVATDALNPNMTRLARLFNEGDLAIIRNIGALVQPTSKQALQGGGAALPPQLFSHNSQRLFVASGKIGNSPTGWGGRIADALAAYNAHPEFTAMTAAGDSDFLIGSRVRPLAISEAGAPQLLEGYSTSFGTNSDVRITAVSTAANANPLRAEYARTMRSALDASRLLIPPFASIVDSQLEELVLADNELASQLRSVARAISSARPLGMKRQVFYVEMQGWDSHNSGGQPLPDQFARLDAALAGFHKILARWGLADNVTSFTLSDFGRTLASNGDGSDHGWGGLSLVLGGAVAGRQLVGRAHAIGLDTADTFNGGRLIPTTGIDQLAATLATWMGVDAGNLGTIAPNLGNFPTADRLLRLFR